ncbi:hypothetical protein, partial [Kaarinaea lacus]
MMRIRFLPFLGAAFLTCIVGTPVVADDGAINNKSMTRTIEPPVIDYGQAIVNEAVREAEHAFTDMMKFYVPAQAASGAFTPIAYCDIDNQPASGEDCTNAVETLEVAKPLVNVLIYGPAFHVDNTAFAHRFFDTFVAVSLDDGVTWKQTNLSRSADLSSFNIEEDHNPKGKDPLPSDHTILLGEDEDDEHGGRDRDDDDDDQRGGRDRDDDNGDHNDEGAYHARGYDTPYTSECFECHGVALQGTAQTPSCYSCHDNEWEEPTPIDLGPIITNAEYEPKNKNKGTLELEGENAAPRVDVTIING